MSRRHGSLDYGHVSRNKQKFKLGACYIWPSVGQFSNHPSGVGEHKGPSVTISKWQHTSVMSGTRLPPSDHRHIQLLAFTDKGNPTNLCTITAADLDGNTLDWKSWCDGKKEEVKHTKTLFSRAEVEGRKMHLSAEEMRTENNEFGVSQKLLDFRVLDPPQSSDSGNALTQRKHRCLRRNILHMSHRIFVHAKALRLAAH